MPRPTVTKRLRNPRALSSALTSLETLQPRALGSLNRLVTLVSASNLYLVNSFIASLACFLTFYTWNRFQIPFKLLVNTVHKSCMKF